MVYIKLFWEFLKVGLFSFGGAYSGIPLVRDVVAKNNWCTIEQFADIVAISEATPGSIIVNLATYVGSLQGGFLGAIVATTAAILPAFILILIFAIHFKKYINRPIINSIFKTIRISITAVIMATGIIMLYENVFGQNINDISNHFPNVLQKLIITILMIIIMFLYMKKNKKMNTIIFIVISAILGIIVFTLIPCIQYF